MQGLSVVVTSGGHSSLRCAGLSLLRSLLLRSTGSRRAGSVVVAHRLSSCGSRAQLLRGMWDLPRPGLEPVSPALAGGFSTAAPPGKPINRVLFFVFLWGFSSVQLFRFFKVCVYVLLPCFLLFKCLIYSCLKIHNIFKGWPQCFLMFSDNI